MFSGDIILSFCKTPYEQHQASHAFPLTQITNYNLIIVQSLKKQYFEHLKQKPQMHQMMYKSKIRHPTSNSDRSWSRGENSFVLASATAINLIKYRLLFMLCTDERMVRVHQWEIPYIYFIFLPRK